MNTKAQGPARAPKDGRRPRMGRTEDELRTLQAVARAKDGDRMAVRYLYSRYSDTVRRYAAALLRDTDAADDVVQTTFLKLLTKIDRYEPRSVPFEAWLLRVTRNVALDEVRRRAAHPQAPVLETDAPTTEAPAAERNGTLRAALGHLPQGEREVLLLRHLVGLNDDEIATRLGTDATEVQRTHRRAQTRLKFALAGTAKADSDAPVFGGSRARRRPLIQVMQ
jgi:RNA polymerase sigma-70 factor, ECF subfamily